MLEDVRRLRRHVSNTLTSTFSASPLNASEVELRDTWRERLADDTLTVEGWYMPPPHGIIFGLGHGPNFERVNRGTFRPRDSWPRKDIQLDNSALVFAYASPVDKKTGLIGDLACSLYCGTDLQLRSHLRNTWATTMAIAELARPQMTFAEVHDEAQALIAAAGLQNIVHSVHGGSTSDIGHTLPWSGRSPSTEELRVLTTGTSQQIAELVSSQRIFVNATNHATIKNDIAFTIEPRLVAPGLPMAGFHVVVVIENGIKEVVTEFDPLFEYFEMDYLVRG